MAYSIDWLRVIEMLWEISYLPEKNPLNLG